MKRDLLPECNDGKTPLDVFQSWCARCLNLECTRSIGGKSKFEQRVTTWEERLFKSPPRMSSDDPRFERITAQRFVTIDVGRTPELRSAWVDPTDLKEPSPSREPVALPVPPVVEPRIIEQPQAALPKAIPTGLVQANAPDQSGKVLPRPPSSDIPRPDPWAAPAPPEPNDLVIQPGATVKLRGSGV